MWEWIPYRTKLIKDNCFMTLIWINAKSATKEQIKEIINCPIPLLTWGIINNNKEETIQEKKKRLREEKRQRGLIYLKEKGERE